MSGELMSLTGFGSGDLIKLENDHDPTTHEDEVVYYFDRDWVRHSFPNRKIYDSWYEDFSTVKEATREEMALMRLGSNVVYRPGTRLIKIPSIPKVYAVEPVGVIRWIETEEAALSLYGPDWAKKVDDVSEAFFTDYTEGPPIRTAAWPTGTLLRRASDTALFLVDGDLVRHINPADVEALRIQDKYAVSVDAIPEPYTNAGAITGTPLRYTDTSQTWYVDTLPFPQIDFPVGTSSVEAGEDRVLGVMRITSGMPVIVRDFTARIEGELWDGSTPNFTDLKLVDVVTGTNLFGTKQLESAGAEEEDVLFSGAYTLQPDSEAVIEFRATVSGNVPAGSSVSVRFDRDKLSVYDGGGGTTARAFFPGGAFPEMASRVE